MRFRQGTLILLLALSAGLFGLLASVALYGPGPLLRSQLGQALLSPWIQGPRVDVGARVPPFVLPGLGGPAMTLPTVGSPALVNYWASWCAPCLDELPLLSAFAARQGTNGVKVIAVALDDRDAAATFLRQHPLGFPSLVEAPGDRDSSVRLGNSRGVLPFTVLIGADGRLRKRQSGAFRDAQDLEAWATSP
jgi:thiol-disulfide isomerase/thioredoxin